MAAFLEEGLRVCFLEIAGADLRRGDLRGNAEDGHARSMTIEKTVDEMEIAWSAAACADGKFASQMRLGARCKSGDLFMPDMDPLDFGLLAKRVGEPV